MNILNFLLKYSDIIGCITGVIGCITGMKALSISKKDQFEQIFLKDTFNYKIFLNSSYDVIYNNSCSLEDHYTLLLEIKIANAYNHPVCIDEIRLRYQKLKKQHLYKYLGQLEVITKINDSFRLNFINPSTQWEFPSYLQANEIQSNYIAFCLSKTEYQTLFSNKEIVLSVTTSKRNYIFEIDVSKIEIL